ncbi:MAG: zinc-ribbon domain-containing protein [Pirellulales bacterium]|nr:zinc-ribbon domain-containing protein [Pirellulales bacterium]
MPIAVICPGCKTSFRVSEKFAGKQGPCPKCKASITIPKAAEVEIHAPAEFTHGGTTAGGQPSFKPVARSNRKFSPPVAMIAGFSAIVVVVVTWLMGRSDLFAATDSGDGLAQFGSGEMLVGIGLLVFSPLFAWTGYQTLRESELEPHTGLSVILRATICGLVYTGLWAGYRLVPESFTEAVWTWAVILTPMLVVGTLVAMGCFDLEMGSAFVHYALYVAICMGLAWIGGRDIIPSIVTGDVSSPVGLIWMLR